MKHLVNSTSSLSAQKSSSPARPAGLREKWCWNEMAPESCTKTPGFVIMNTLSLLLWEIGLNLLSLIYWPYKVFSSRKKTSCMFSPPYFIAFHCLWGGRQWDDCSLQCWWTAAVGPLVAQWIRICLYHCYMKTGTETSIVPAMEVGQVGAGGKPTVHIVSSSAFSLAISSAFSHWGTSFKSK